MTETLAAVGVTDVEWVHARPPSGQFDMSNMRRAPRGEFGANLSHLKAVMHALLDGAERPLFLEDDLQFLSPERLPSAVAQLPNDWDVLYLGGHPRGPAPAVRPYSEHLWTVQLFSFAEAYSLRRPALRRFFDHWCDRIGQPEAMFDFALGEFAGANKGFCVYPLVTSQLPGRSQISGKDEDKASLLERGWLKHIAFAKSGAY